MKSLNEIYDKDEMFYYCNACGDVNIPNTDPWSLHSSDELPMLEKELYENYWTDDTSGCMYVVNYKGNPMIALGYLFCETYLSDIKKAKGITEYDMSAFYNVVLDYANMLEQNSIVNECEILVGNNTDPDGHELIILIPYDNREDIANIVQTLDDIVYDGVESLM